MAIYSMGRRRVIALLILTSVLLITLDTRGNALIDRARSVLSLVLEPFDAAARTVSRPVLNAWDGIVNYDDLRRENEALRAEIATQRGAEIEARAAILEYQELLTLNRLLGTGAYPTVAAQVQGERSSNFQYTVEINRGSKDGIEVGMPVVNGAGLVGKISRVFPNSAIVLLIIDPDFNIGAKVLTPSTGSTTTTSPPLRPTEGDATSPTTTTTTTAPAIETPEEAATGPLDPFDPSVTTTVAPTTTLPIPGSNEAAAGATTTSTTTVATGATTTTVPTDIIRETGTITGQGLGEPLLLRFVDDSTTQGRVQAGSPVQTAGGLRSIAPAGIPIGEVGAIR
ncbi:MAG: rod shape-determining protein MreC, partial [Ilumatobacteraceae bacterium]